MHRHGWAGFVALRIRRRKRTRQILALDRVEMAPPEKGPGIVFKMGAESRPQKLGTKTEPRFRELRGSDLF
jgi:hypothetical protein